MVDVDQCSRYAEAGLCDNFAENATKISALDNSLRNIIFRNKSTEQIEQMLEAFSRKIKETVSARFGFECVELYPSSNNNRDGADLYALMPSDEKVIIEVKFGFYTDKAAGMAQFAKIFGTTIFSDALSIGQRRLWREMVAAEYPDLSRQMARTAQTLNSAVEEFNELMEKNGYVLSEESQMFMEDYLLNNSGNYDSHTKNYIRFEVNQKGTEINDVAIVQKGCGTWKVEKVEPVDFDRGKMRVNVFAQNDVTNLRIKFTLNNKNNLHIYNMGITIESKYMLNSPSWNVWIQEDKTVR